MVGADGAGRWPTCRRWHWRQIRRRAGLVALAGMAGLCVQSCCSCAPVARAGGVVCLYMDEIYTRLALRLAPPAGAKAAPTGGTDR
jgi:hypothetical protein